ncbi:hypothetical protein SAY86_002220 [Trapa natans]|uniref:Myb/SANT-like DNA-binding domain-containing protein n=1 Tax=Trapa natans TaxID=22666 RepID=A0AAN7LFN6_TRANT|nr:hypothetical protein SAY86_002220 [Trapa natans]
MATSPSSPSSNKPSGPYTTAAADTAAAPTSPSPKPPPATWGHQETVHLIQIYQDRWYSNNRVHLKSPQWEEVAAALTARSDSSRKLLPKTSIQCRHKMEKLRKRFRAERQRGGGGPTGWPYYDLMDRLERGPKFFARPITIIPHRAKASNFHSNIHSSRGQVDDDYDEDEGEPGDYGRDNDNYEEDEEEAPYSRSQSINYILRRPAMVNRFPSVRSFSDTAVPGFVPRHLSSKRTREEEATDAEVVQEESERMRKAAIWKMAEEIRAFAETFVGMEGAKMEMMKKAEKSRLEMESKRMEMILESQRKIVEAIADAFSSPREEVE